MLKHTIRSLRSTPGFTTIAILTLSLGIGANTAMFSVLNGVLYRPLPYPRSDELVRVASRMPALGFEKFWLSPPEYFELHENTRTLSGVGAYRTGTVSVGGDDAPVRATVASATHTLFTTLGVPAALGRVYGAEEDQPGGPAVAVLSWDLWQSAFGADPAIVGRDILVNGRPVRVTGVMPAGFDVAESNVEIWLPMQLDRTRMIRRTHFLDVVARVKPGTTVEQAQADLSRLVQQWRNLAPDAHTPDPQEHPVYAVALRDDVVGSARSSLLVLFGAVSLVLLIACANVANLLLARAETRQREIAVRVALGATRLQLLRQFLTEGLVLSGVGAAVGLWIGDVGVRALVALNPDAVPRAGEITIDARVMAFTLGIAVLTGIVFGIAPMLHGRARLMMSSLRDGSGRTTAGTRRLQLRRVLVVAELALAVMLVIGSGLLLRSFGHLLDVDPGFEPEGVLSFQLSLPGGTYVDPAMQVAFYDRLLPRLKALPDVVDVSMLEGLPTRQEVDATAVVLEGVPETPARPHTIDYWQWVGPDYFETMRIPLLRGRTFTPADATGSPVVLINERLAQVFYPGVDPIGRRMRMPGPEAERPWMTIVGVVKDVKQRGLQEDTGTEFYFYYPRSAGMFGLAPRDMSVVIRTNGDPRALVSAVRAEVARVDPTVPIADIAPMTEVLSHSLARPRFLAVLLGLFSALALTLAAIGTYGVMAYTVTQRRQEIGIRMALGARAPEVMRVILLDGAVMAAFGIAIGIAGAFALTTVLESMLFGISPTDPLTFAFAPAILGLVALSACAIPVRNAMRVDPAETLKN